MKRYDTYKESGIEWIGEIPSHWDVKSLKRLAKIGNGQDHKSVWDENGEFPIIGTGGVFGKANNYLHTGPSVILGRKGTIDKPQFVETPFWSVDTAYHTNINSNVHPKLFYYLCTTINFDLYRYGSAVPSMTQEVLNQIPFVISKELQEQTAIAAYLDRKTAEIDALIADKKCLLELYDEEKTAIINQAVTKGIDPNAKMKDSGIEWLGEIPEHWEVIPLTKYLESIVDYRGRTPKKQHEGLFLVTARNIKNRIIDYSLSEEFVDNEDALNLLERGKPKVGDVLFTTEAPLGEVANIDREDIALAQRVIKFRGKIGILDNYFLMLFLSSDCFKQDLYTYSTGSTAIGIKASKLHHLKCLLPPLIEQQSIVRHIENECPRIDTKIAKTQKLIELLTEYRTALISEVVTGKIKVI